jgi:hypothetical protein
MSQVGIEAIGYTQDGFVFFKILTTYEDKPISTMVQFHPDNADSFCKCLMEAATKARETKELSN